jgi:hypothetical protein
MKWIGSREKKFACFLTHSIIMPLLFRLRKFRHDWNQDQLTDSFKCMFETPQFIVSNKPKHTKHYSNEKGFNYIKKKKIREYIHLAFISAILPKKSLLFFFLFCGTNIAHVPLPQPSFFFVKTMRFPENSIFPI